MRYEAVKRCADQRCEDVWRTLNMLTGSTYTTHVTFLARISRSHLLAFLYASGSARSFPPELIERD